MDTELSKEFLDNGKKKKIICRILIVFLILVVLLSLILGLVFGLKKDDDDDEDDVEIENSYENTEELMKKFPLETPITVQEDIEKKFKIVYLPALKTGTEDLKLGKNGELFYTHRNLFTMSMVSVSL